MPKDKVLKQGGVKNTTGFPKFTPQTATSRSIKETNWEKVSFKLQLETHSGLGLSVRQLDRQNDRQDVFPPSTHVLPTRPGPERRRRRPGGALVHLTSVL